jgi:hypothetical protein
MSRSVLEVLLIAGFLIGGSACTDRSPVVPTGNGSTLVLCNPGQLDPDRPLAGCWIGTFDTTDAADCHTGTPATATFTQDGSSVVGTLSAENACGLDEVAFHGVLEGTRLSGNLVKGSYTGTAAGELSADRLELATSDLRSGSSITPAGQMHLHR